MLPINVLICFTDNLGIFLFCYMNKMVCSYKDFKFFVKFISHFNRKIFIAAGRCRARQRLKCYVVSVISMTLNLQRDLEVTQ